MGRLFAGTPWDRPPTCDRCGRLESECACPPPAVERPKVDPARHTARLRVEKRPKGKVVTAVLGLAIPAEDLADLAALLKARCGSGGTVKEGAIEIQGDHLAAAEKALSGLGYKVRRG